MQDELNDNEIKISIQRGLPEAYFEFIEEVVSKTQLGFVPSYNGNGDMKAKFHRQLNRFELIMEMKNEDVKQSEGEDLVFSPPEESPIPTEGINDETKALLERIEKASKKPEALELAKKLGISVPGDKTHPTQIQAHLRKEVKAGRYETL